MLAGFYLGQTYLPAYPATSSEISLTLVDSLAISENLIRSVARTFVEASLSISDSITRSRPVILLDSLGISEVFTSMIISTKNLYDSVSVSEFFAKQITSFRVFSDSVTISDNIVKYITQMYSDTVTLLDSIGFGSFKSFVDSLSLSENLQFSKAKLFEETLAILDIMNLSRQRLFEEIVNVVDTIEKLSKRLFLESLTIADSLSKQVQKLFTEALSITEVFAKVWALRKKPEMLLASIKDDTLIGSVIKRFITPNVKSNNLYGDIKGGIMNADIKDNKPDIGSR